MGRRPPFRRFPQRFHRFDTVDPDHPALAQAQNAGRIIANSNDGFEERLARIAQKQGLPETPPEQPDAPQPKGAAKKTGGGFDPTPLLRPLLTVVVLLGGIVAYMVLSSEENVVARMVATATAEQEGRTTIGTLLSSANDSLGNIGTSYATRKRREMVRAKLDSGEWTQAQADRALAAIEASEGKSMADIAREGMRGSIRMQASGAGQDALGQEFSDKLDRCRTVECLSVVETQFTIALQARK